jgi:PAS domain S-box-containing protein
MLVRPALGMNGNTLDGRKPISHTAGFLVLAIALSVVLVIAISSYRDSVASERVSERREINERIAQGAANLFSLLRDAESGQRGFLLTGREYYLAPYRKAIADAPRVLSLLAESTATRPDQASRLETLKPLVQEKFAELQRTIGLYGTSGVHSAVALVLTDQGKDVMDRISKACTEIEKVATERVLYRSEEARVTATRTRVVSTAGSALLFVLLILATISIRRTTLGQQKLIAALQDSEARTELIVETALDAVITVDDNGIITGWNRQAEATLGWTGPQAIGQVLEQTIIPARSRETDVLGLERNRIQRQVGTPGQRMEITALHRDGREFPAEIAAVPIHRGESLFFSLFLRNITGRKRAAQKIEAQLARLDLLNRITHAVGERQDLRSIFQVVVRSLEDQLPIDFSCMCLYDAARASLLITSIGVKNQSLGLDLALTEQGHIPIDQNGLSQCVEGHLVYEPDISTSEFPFPKRLATGGFRSLVMAPLLLEQKVFGVLIASRREPNSFTSGDCEFLRQLSEHVALAAHQAQINTSLQQAYDDLRQTQQAMLDQERLRALGQMASGIAHDINNALSPMSAHTELLLEQEPNLSANMRQYLETVGRSVDDVVHTVSRLRDFSRRREPQSKMTPVHLNRLVEQVLDFTRARWSNMAQQGGIVIQARTELAPDLPMIPGIESEIREALINLVFNAVDAMPDGGILTLRTRVDRRKRTPAMLRSVHVEVQDTGLGMDEETRRRCLEPFFTTKGERGTGLGLAMVFGIASRHDGEIEIDSSLGTGTTVRLIFPETAVAKTPQAPQAHTAAPPPQRILVVDDDPLILTVLKAILEADGHSVATASGGQEGIDVFRLAESEERFSIVMTDLGMPHVDGHAVASAVKAMRPSAQVILLTGWGQRLVEEDEMPPYIDRILNKPPKLRELRVALGELMTRSHSAGSA